MGKIKGIKVAYQDWKDDKRAMIAGQVRAQYFERWMQRTEEVTGKPCGSYKEILWEDPQIKIEYLLCDPLYCLKFKNPKVQEEFLAMLTDEEKKLFFYRDEQGHSYSDLLDVKITESLKALYKGKDNTDSGI